MLYKTTFVVEVEGRILSSFVFEFFPEWVRAVGYYHEDQNCKTQRVNETYYLRLHDNYVLVPIDKSSNPVVLICNIPII